MGFVLLGGVYYNRLALGKTYIKTYIDEETQAETVKYFVETLGGQEIEITEEEYNSLLNE